MRSSSILLGCALATLAACGPGEQGRDDAGSLTGEGDAAAIDSRPQDNAADRPGLDAGGSSREGCKRGVAYTFLSESDMRALAGAVSWWYRWAPGPEAPLASGAYRDMSVEFVPMIWGGTFEVAKVLGQIPGDARFLLGFNEPNFYSQANLAAAEAAARWPAVQDIATRRGLVLVSPAVNYCGGGCHDTDPFSYLQAFLAACTDCRVDAVAFHVYVGVNRNGGNKAQWLINHVEKYKATFTQPLWLTEFAADDATSLEEQRQFMLDAVAYLEAEPRVARYAWFSGRADNMKNVDLLAKDGALSTLGAAYVQAPQPASCLR